ncbi:MAG: alpha-1,2-fucosyltransferase [Minisyncoccia bacterium]
MIISKLTGGLGNQMFQYAFGLRLSKKNKLPYKIDIGEYKDAVADPVKGLRVFSLSHFNISVRVASNEEIQKFDLYLKKPFFKKLLRFYTGKNSYFKRKYIIEPESNYFRFDSRILNYSIKNDVYVEGFWQSEKYFNEIEDVIRKEFSFKNEPDKINKKIIEDIQAENSVSIHIRHGDNANKYAQAHGVLPIEYYHTAIEKLLVDVVNPIFYVFSDDPKWAEENLKLSHKTLYISHNGDEKNYEDLRLMTHCRHHIIGNSTFSWWGAWLGKKPNQIVFASKTYHTNVDISGSDFIPPNWHLV